MRTLAVILLLLLAPLTAHAQAKPGGKLVLAARQDSDTLDPHITNRAATRQILIQFTDTLTVISAKDGKVLPGLAVDDGGLNGAGTPCMDERSARSEAKRFARRFRTGYEVSMK